MDSIPYSEVRAQLAQTLKRLEVREEAVYISRRGQPAGVLMSVAQYQRLQEAPGDFGAALLAWRKRSQRALAGGIAQDWPDPFADVRDHNPDGGRAPLDWSAAPSARAAAPTAPMRRTHSSSKKT